MKRFIYIIFAAALVVSGCYKDEITQIENEISSLRNTGIKPLSAQIESVKESLKSIGDISAETKKAIEALRKTSSQLKQDIAATDASIDEVKAALKELNSAKNTEVLAYLETVKTYLESQLAYTEQTLASLVSKYESLESQAAQLQTYVEQDFATVDYVKGTYATIEQQNAIIAEVANIKEEIKGIGSTAVIMVKELNEYTDKKVAELSSDLNISIATMVTKITKDFNDALSKASVDLQAAYSEEFAAAISASEAGIMSWVNDQLKDYCLLADAEAQILVFKNKIGNVPAGKSLQGEIESLQAQLQQAREDITAAYTKAIADAINNSEAKLNEKIAADINALRTQTVDPIVLKVTELESSVLELSTRIENMASSLNTIEEQIKAINTSIAVLDELKLTLEQYVDGIVKVLKEKDVENEQALMAIVNRLQEVANGDQESSLKNRIAALRSYIGTLPQGKTDVATWVQTTCNTLDQQFSLYATIEYVNGLFNTLKTDIGTNETNLKAVEDDLKTVIEDNKDKINGWISERLADYYTGAQFEGKLAALKDELTTLYTDGDKVLEDNIDDIREKLTSSLATLREKYAQAIETAISEYNGLLPAKITSAFAQANQDVDNLGPKVTELETAISGIKDDITTVNADIATLKEAVLALQTFVGAYTNLKDIVDELKGKIDNLPNLYADKATLEQTVADVATYKTQIDLIEGLEQSVINAENSVESYLALIGEYDLKSDKLKALIEGMQNELATLKNTVFGTAGTDSIQKRINDVNTAKGNILTKLKELEDAILEEVSAVASIEYIPRFYEGTAMFEYTGSNYSATFEFEVRPRHIASAVASHAVLKYISTPTKGLNYQSFGSCVASGDNDKGILSVTVTVAKTSTILSGTSAVLLVSGEKMDYVSDFIPMDVPDSPEDFYILPSTIDLESVDAAGVVKLVSTAQWEVTDKPTWISCTPSSGSRTSGTNITIAATDNNYGNPRSGTITFTATSRSMWSTTTLTRVITVNQDGRADQTFTNFDPASGTYQFSFKGNILNAQGEPTAEKNATVTVTTSDGFTDWTASSDLGWVTINPKSKEDNHITFSVGMNDNTEDRTGIIKFKPGYPETAAEVEYKFTQKARGTQTLTFNPSIEEGVAIPFSGEATKIEVVPSDDVNDWLVAKGTDSDWITIDESHKADGYVLVSTDRREAGHEAGSVEFTSKGSDPQTYVYPVSQSARAAQILYDIPANLDEDYTKHNYTFVVRSSDGQSDWTYPNGQVTDWLKISRGADGKTMTFSFTKNEGAARGPYNAVFKSYDGTEYICVVTQKSRTQTIDSVSPASILFSADGSMFSSDGGQKWSDSHNYGRSLSPKYDTKVTVTTSDRVNDWIISSDSWSGGHQSKSGNSFYVKALTGEPSWKSGKPSGTVTVSSFDGLDSKSVSVSQNRPLTITVNSTKDSDGYYTVTVKSDSKWRCSSIGSNLKVSGISTSGSYNQNPTSSFTFKAKRNGSGMTTLTFRIYVENEEGGTDYVTIQK